ncbi:hypothetical protein HD806DRAFT_187844 [Xylariaceae sp. AK1471]|nr:hypothetical protein HD806DRAFT_187844 [Xylariaceae sp. AK1471]
MSNSAYRIGNKRGQLVQHDRIQTRIIRHTCFAMVARSAASLNGLTRKSIVELKGTMRQLLAEPSPAKPRPVEPRKENAPLPLSQIIKPRPAKSLSEQTPAYTSFDIHFDIKNLSTLAARNGGRDALHILDRLRDPDDSVLVSKGIRCLQAYYDRYDPLPLEKARKMIINDNAARLVTKWVQKPAVWNQIVNNHPENIALLKLAADILVGALQTDTLERWLCYISPTVAQMMRSKGWTQELKENTLWSGRLFHAINISLFRWNPKGSGDDAYDFYSKMVKKRKVEGMWYISISAANISIHHIMRMSRNGTAESFERCMKLAASTHARSFLDSRAIPMLFHPTKPAADLLLDKLYQFTNNPDKHRLEILENSKANKVEYSKWVCSCGWRAASILREQGRHDEARWAFDTIQSIWGWGARSFYWKTRRVNSSARTLDTSRVAGKP